MDLEALNRTRSLIDQIDDEIMALISKRMEAAKEIGLIKGSSPIYDPKREEAVIRRLTEENLHLGESLIRGVMGEIMGACRAIQEPFRVAVMGPKWSHSHDVAIKLFGGSSQVIFARYPRDAIAMAASGEVHGALVPLENSLEGAVHSTLDGLMEFRGIIRINREVRIKVEHCLATQREYLGDIKRVYSHPQAMGQCEMWLRRNLPWAELAEVSSTSEGARRAMEEQEAAVCSMRCAQEMGFLRIIPRIQDSHTNTTRFVVILKADPRREQAGGDRTTIVFTLPHRPGSLCEALEPLMEHRVNLMMIQSRPMEKNPFQYAFFADLEGGLGDPNVDGAISAMAHRTSDLTVLGSYPCVGI